MLSLLWNNIQIYSVYTYIRKYNIQMHMAVKINNIKVKYLNKYILVICFQKNRFHCDNFSVYTNTVNSSRN